MKIKHKLFLSFGILILLSFAIVGLNQVTYQAIESDANFVNFSGKLRATSFKMAQLSNVIINEGDSNAANSLAESISLFDTIINDISQGNANHGLSKLTHEVTITKLNTISDEWNLKFKKSYQAVIDQKDEKALAQINNDVAGYVDLVNEMVTSYSEYSNEKVANAKLINFIMAFVALIISIISITLLNKGIRKPIGALIEELKALSQGDGDLTKRIKVNSRDEIGEMIKYFNIFITNIHEIVNDISKISLVLSGNMNSIAGTTEELTKSTEMIALSSTDVAEGSLEQNNKLEQLNMLVERIKQDIEDVSKKALQALKSSEKSQNSVEEGDNQVNIQANELNKFVSSIKNASNTVEDLNQSSERIKAIVDIIHSISSQTNLLALNASIEAARAGEAGRGFAVVANEIRTLAEETSSSAKEINEIVGSIGQKTINVKSSMDDLVDKTKIQEESMELLKNELKDILAHASVTLGEAKNIMAISSQVNNDFSKITLSAKDIQGVAEHNAGNTQDVAAAVEEQTASFEEVTANINSINEMAGNLTNIVRRFKL